MTLTTDVSVIFADARQVRADDLERLAGGLTSQRRVSHQTTPVKTGAYHALSRDPLDSCLRRNGVALQPTLAMPESTNPCRDGFVPGASLPCLQWSGFVILACAPRF